MKLNQEEDRPCNYSYDMRGRLKSMISPAFSQELYREDGASPCYNGSISSMRYSYDDDFETGSDRGDKVTYGYDALGRLVGSESTDGYDTSYGYDLNSSPTAIVRNGLTSDGFSIGVVDDLELRYDGNRLKKVIDLADAVNIESSLDFVESSDETSDLYDESGRLTAWPGLEGSSIKYAPNDMPVMIYTKDGSVEYRYRADGTKLATFVTTSEPSAGLGSLKELVTRKHYDIGSFRFCSSRRNPQMVLERVNLPWGYFDASAQANVYIKDYQGNIRAVYNQDDDCIVQQTDYYPYGLPKATSTGAEVNPFKYGGKELNTRLPQPFYDFVARMQLPQLCLFQRPDPKASDYTWLNPFTYCAGNPINKIDPDGCRELPIDEVYNNQSWRHSNNFNVTDLNKRFHRGVDINIGSGDHDKGAPVYSTIKGKVVSINSYKDGNYGGNRVVIASEDGVVETKYMHLDTFSPDLTVGMDISEGQQIGTIGNTGRSKGPHLHYEIWVNNQPINPASDPNNLIDPQKLISIDNNDYRGILDEMVVYGIGNPHPQLKIQVIEPNFQLIERKSKLKL